jgi:hypothetical protein
MEAIGGETVVLLEAWLLAPFLAEYKPRLPGEIPNTKKLSKYLSVIQ